MKKLLFFILLITTLSALAENKPLPTDEAFQLTATARDYQTILLQWHIAPGHFLYQKHFSFHVVKPKNVQLAEPLLPSDDQPLKTTLGTFAVYANHMIIPIPIIDATQKELLLQV